MKKYITILGLLISFSASAQSWLKVYHLNDFLRIVISSEKCLLPGFEGKEAVAHGYDGKYIKGCYTDDPKNSEQYKIMWNNNAKYPGDFSAFPKNLFKDVE